MKGKRASGNARRLWGFAVEKSTPAVRYNGSANERPRKGDKNRARGRCLLASELKARVILDEETPDAHRAALFLLENWRHESHGAPRRAVHAQWSLHRERYSSRGKKTRSLSASSSVRSTAMVPSTTERRNQEPNPKADPRSESCYSGAFCAENCRVRSPMMLDAAGARDDGRYVRCSLA